MRKILSLILGLLWVMPAWGACYDYTSATGTVVQDGTPTPENPIEPVFYQQGNMILRAVGDVADSYDATTGKITRRVGVKVLDGTEDWGRGGNNTGVYTVFDTAGSFNVDNAICQHFGYTTGGNVNIVDMQQNTFCLYSNGNIAFKANNTTNVATWKAFLTEQYAAGTPVTIYYPLATAVEEDWTETSYCSAPIKIATTKYNESAFGPLNTALQNAISVVDTVVSNTITQAASIATLQAQKQTRPNDIADDNEKCPAGKKCLLVEDASGIPHWYEIVENAWDLPVGYTQLQWIKSTGAQWIDTGYVLNSNTDNVEIVFQADSVDTNINLFGARGSTTSKPYTFGAYQGGWRFGWYDRSEVFGTADTNKHTVKIEHTGGILKIDDVIIAEMGSESFTTPFNAALFGVMANSMYYGTFTIYSYKKWTNDELVQYFIPAQRNSDNVLGMYDLVSGQFFTNQGTGSFVAGPVAQ